MKRILSLLVILSVLLIANSAFSQDDTVKHIFDIYDNKTVKLDFEQTSINAMSGQKIEKKGTLTIKPKKEMIFDYENEDIRINNFEVIDYRDNKKYIYRLEGFNKVLFLLFLGQKDIEELFSISRNGDEYVFKPKYDSNIDRVYALFGKDRIKKLIITDIYSNQTIYRFSTKYIKRW